MLTIVGCLTRSALRPVPNRALPLTECAEGHQLWEERVVFGKVDE